MSRPPNDPESLLKQAQTEMREAEGRHRQRMVDAITTKNHLQQEVNDMQARVDSFRNKATLAAERGDENYTQQVRRAGEHHEKILALMQEKISQIEAIAEHLKQTFHLQDEVFQQRITEIFVLKVQYQMSVLQKQMVDAMLGEADDTPAKRRAREKSRHIVLLDAQKREKELAALVEAAEKEVERLRAKLLHARHRNNELAEHEISQILEPENETLLVLREALDRARDVRERAERWRVPGKVKAATAPKTSLTCFFGYPSRYGSCLL